MLTRGDGTLERSWQARKETAPRKGGFCVFPSVHKEGKREAAQASISLQGFTNIFGRNIFLSVSSRRANERTDVLIA